MRLSLSNLGTAPLEIRRFGQPKSPFSLGQSTPTTAIIEPGESLVLDVVFHPEEAKNSLTSFEIHSNAHKQHIAIVRLSGTGTE